MAGKVPILKEGPSLIVSIQSELTDIEWLRLKHDLLDAVGRYGSSGVIIDVTMLEVLDSFATRTIHTLAKSVRLRGAETVLVGIQPAVALAMVQLGLIPRLEKIATGLDLEEGLALLRGGGKPGD